MTETTVGREPVQIVKIRQDFCTRSYGVAPCTASGPGNLKCYNTRATCQDTANYAIGPRLDLYFSRGSVAEQSIDGVDYIFPSLISVSTTPSRVNLAGANSDMKGLGTRAVCNIVLRDHAHNDRIVDPYLDERDWDPLDPPRGSFWTRWIARNRFYNDTPIVIYDGYAGQSLSEMTARTYFMTEVKHSGPSGQVTITGKDILSRAEARQAQAPLPSPGDLYASLTDSATSFEVQNATTADYPSSTGLLRIDDELISYAARSNTANGVTFTGCLRGRYGTVAAAHDAEAAVQLCIEYLRRDVDVIVEDLLTEYAGINSAYLDTTNWATEVSTYLSTYTMSTVISEPTSVYDLISSLQQQALFYIWWDEREAIVKLRAIRDITEEPDLLTDESHIIEGSFSLSERPRDRISRAVVYYGVREWGGDLEDAQNYKRIYIAADLDSETTAEYGSPSTRKIFGRWIARLVGGPPSVDDAIAEATGDSLIARYVNTPVDASFQLDAKDRSYWVGDIVRISHYLDVDSYGARNIRYWLITSAEEIVPGEIAQYTAEDVTGWVA